MRTIKREPAYIDTVVANLSKYHNQLNFTGIKIDKNIFAVDQASQIDTLNVYVNEEQTLVSREPVQIARDFGGIVDIKKANNITVTVVRQLSSSGFIYIITAINDNNSMTDDITTKGSKYHVCIFNQYVICFREEGAMVIDTSDGNEYRWKELSSYVDIPITKITTGLITSEKDDNQFTKSYIHRYVRTDEVPTILPEPDEDTIITAKYISANGESKYEGVNTVDGKIWKVPEYRFTVPLPFKPSNFYSEETKDVILGAKNVLIIAKPSMFLISYDYGRTYTQVRYPISSIRFNKDLKAISEDGKAFFYCTDSGIYRCSLADYTWTRFTYHNMTDTDLKSSNYNGLGLPKDSGYDLIFSQMYHFKNAEVFCCELNGVIFYKAPGMCDKDGYENQLCKYGELGEIFETKFGDIVANRSIKIAVNNEGIGYLAYAKFDYDTRLDLYTSTNSTFVTIIGNGNNKAISYKGSGPLLHSLHKAITVESIEYLADYNETTPRAIRIKGVVNRVNGYTDSNSVIGDGSYEYTYIMGHDNNKDVFVENNIDSFELGLQLFTGGQAEDIGTPIKLTDRLYITYNYSGYIDFILDTTKLIELQSTPDVYYSFYDYCYPILTLSNISLPTHELIITDDIFYMYLNNSSEGDNYIISNKLSNNERIEVDYQYKLDYKYNLVPDLSYSGEELFLVFGNQLQITKNSVKDLDTLFSLPKINNQKFSNNISNIINISTSELALFFNDSIIICTKQSDDIFGYVYHYSKTRLSLGVRYGDDVINTLDGANTVLPTVRGLAIMNYQAYMATTDQILNFVSDSINELWNEFYNENRIKLVQVQDYVYISNQTDVYLMLDLRTMSWWKFKIPFAIKKFITNHNVLQFISSKLYEINPKFNKNKYVDCDGSRIDWYLTSQRLHFNAPNHYKNLKQLIFHLVQPNDFKNTINTRIKLYRKTVTYKEPEIIDFKIDEYRTFVKRFNYWKINELQYGLENDKDTAAPAQLILNGIDIKYEIGEEVR